MQDQIAALQTRLREKEQLVAALTERLEQAAEQLDRVHRTGADRGARVTGGGLPPEIVEQQKQLTDDLQRAVQAWEDMQAAVALGRIEVQVTELRELIADKLSSGAFAGPAVARTTTARPPEEEAPSAIPARARHAENTAEGWEALKASLLAGEGESAPGEPTGAFDAAVGTVETCAGPGREPAAEHADPLPPDADESIAPPEPVDFASATRDDLERAIEHRDEYIVRLARRLRTASAPAGLPQDWEALQTVPDELRKRLQELEQQLESNLRLAELELSLERARLGREEARLRLVEEQLQKETRRMGLLKGKQAAEKPQKPEPPSDGDSEPKGRRWMRMLGMGQEE